MNTGYNKGALIVLCGGEGSGKSTIVQDIKDAYTSVALGGDVKLIVTREPGGSPYAEDIRDIMLKNLRGQEANAETMFGLAWAARADHLFHKIGPARKAGIHVVSDRFDCCTFAYQIYAQEARQLEQLFWAMRRQYVQDCRPNLYIFLDVAVEVGLKRVEGRPGKKNHFDERGIAFHGRIRQGYLKFIEQVRELGSDTIIVDANRPLDDVRVEVLGIVAKLVS